MANFKPIKFEYTATNLASSIAEFQVGDTIDPAYLASIDLSSLGDVSSLMDPDSGQSLVWNGSEWTASTVAGGGGGSESLSGLTDTNISSPTTNQVLQWDGSEWINATNPAGVTDLSGMGDVSIPASPTVDGFLAWNGSEWTVRSVSTTTNQNQADHILVKDTTLGYRKITPANLNEAFDLDLLGDVDVATKSANDSLVWDGSEWIASAVTGGAGTTDHNALSNLDVGDPHTQYVLKTVNTDLSTLVDNIETSTVDLSTYISTNEAAWSTDTDTDTDALSSLTDTNISSPSTGQVLKWSGSQWEAADETGSGGSSDHGGLTGLSDNDHPQYVLSATNNNLSSLVTSIETSTVDLSTYIDDEVVLKDGSVDMFSLNVIGSITVTGNVDGVNVSDFKDDFDAHDASASVHFTEASIDHTAIDNIGFYSHAQIDSHINDATKHFAKSDIDIDDLGDVAITGASTGELLRYNGTNWADYTVAATTISSHLDSVYIADSAGVLRKMAVANFEALLDHDNLTNFNANEHFTKASIQLDDLGDTSVGGPSSGQVLTWDGSEWVADTPGSGVTDHTLLSNIGTNTHAQIDTKITELDNHVASGSVHFTEASIDHANIANVGTRTHAQIDSHIADATIHFEKGDIQLDDLDAVSESGKSSGDSLVWNGGSWVASAVTFTDTDTTDHTALTNIGTNTHAQIDTHIADSTLHFTEASIDHTNITNVGTNTHAQIDTHIADSTLHFTEASIDHGSISGLTDDDHTQYTLADGTRSMDTLDVTGNITVDGTVDGRDVATDGTKLDGIEDNATADQTAGEIEGIVSHDNLLDFDANEHFTKASISIGDLGNVDESGKSTGESLVWDGANWSPSSITGGGGGGATNIDGLDDVEITSAADNEVLMYNSSESGWENSTMALNDLNNVAGNPTIGQFLKWGGASWGPDSITVPADLDDLSDASVTSAAEGQILQYNGSNFVNQVYKAQYCVLNTTGTNTITAASSPWNTQNWDSVIRFTEESSDSATTWTVDTSSLTIPETGIYEVHMRIHMSHGSSGLKSIAAKIMIDNAGTTSQFAHSEVSDNIAASDEGSCVSWGVGSITAGHKVYFEWAVEDSNITIPANYASMYVKRIG